MVKKRSSARSVEGKENEMIGLAIDEAERRIRDGTASSQIITHYLKLGTTRERLEKDIMEEKRKLLRAQTESIESSKRIERLYEKAIKAMKTYSPNFEEDDEFDEEDI